MKRFVNLFILIFSISFIFMVASNTINLKCPLKSLFDICCPGCGLTRAFRCILNLDLCGAFKYNILSIPLFLISIILCFYLITDIIKNNNNTFSFINSVLKRYYIIIIIFVVTTMIINNINGI